MVTRAAALLSDTFFFGDVVENAAGSDESSLHDAIEAWLGGEVSVWLDEAGRGKVVHRPVE